MKILNPSLVTGVSLFFLSIAIFLLWPELDWHISALFFDPIQRQFIGDSWLWCRLVYEATPLLSRTFFVLSLLILLLHRWLPAFLRTYHQTALAWVLISVLGAGLLVDIGLKNHVGRPRPVHLSQFNGHTPFVPAFHVSQYCDKNCSFVSGHAAAGFALIALGAWRSQQIRRRWLSIGLCLGSVIGFVRIAQGGHFLSDIVFAGWAMIATSSLIHHLGLYLRHRSYWQDRMRS